MTKHEIPIEQDLIDRLFPFWASIFGEGGDLDPSLFLGEEADTCVATLYLEEEHGRPVATCLTVRSQAIPGLAGFAEVATDPACRGRGLASELCQRAVDDFVKDGGDAFFLGTGNPGAARIYHRLGWRKLAGADVMVNIISGESPEAFLVDFFRTSGEVTVSPAGPDVRIPMIPLIWTPHDSQMLDSNVGLHSRRYVMQPSCMGLYPRYTRSLEGCGAWFAARTKDGRVVGLSSARLMGNRTCQVDGFVHGSFAESWAATLAPAIDWGRSMDADITARVSVEDEDKRSQFESLGFRTTDDEKGSFDLGDRSVPLVQLSLEV